MNNKRAVRAVLLFLVCAFFLVGCNGNIFSGGERLSIEAEICQVKDDRAAIVTIISDDGYYESGVILNSLAKDIGIHVTVSGFVNNIASYLEEWKEIEKEGFVEVISHSYSHLKINDETNPSREEIYHEYVDAKEYYENNFETPAFCFVTPNNATTETGYEILQENNFLAVRQGQRGENSLSPEWGMEPGDWLNLMTRGIGDVDNTEERNKWIDTAIENRSWLIEMWHDISPNGDLHYQPISTEMAKEHLTYISEKQEDVWIAPFTQAVSYIYKKEYCMVEAYCTENEIVLQLSRKRNDLPWDEFNAPISICLKLPDGWEKVHSLEDNCIIQECENPSYIIINTEVTQGALHFTRAE